jgi:KipI family sensor histidine kinase inhibitor
MSDDVRLVRAGDAALIVELGEDIDVAVNARAIGLAARIEAAALAGVRDVVPTYRSVAVHFDPLRTDVNTLTSRLEAEIARSAMIATVSGTPVRIPVCYGGEFGPDLAEVAASAGMSEADVIALHAGATYRVFMMGFLPGFAYLGTVDERIAVPRRLTPRVHVPAGSVGIARRQTGIYPVDGPGGWQLVGRTPHRVFDPERTEPFLLKAGDEVQFYRVDAAECAGGFARLDGRPS